MQQTKASAAPYRTAKVVAIVVALTAFVGTGIAVNTVVPAFRDALRNAQTYGSSQLVESVGSGRSFRANIATTRGPLSRTFPIRFEGGVTYVVGLTCDRNCNDVRLVVCDQNGREQIAIRLPADARSVTFVPPATGTYNATLEMVACNAARCNAGLEVSTQS